MNNYNIGGVQLKDVITFQTQIMMGTQFTRVKNAKNANDIIIACLRLGWNDAFRHTSENVKEGNKTVLELKSAYWNHEHREKYDEYICSHHTFHDVPCPKKPILFLIQSDYLLLHF